jgi:hypothetical protein
MLNRFYTLFLTLRGYRPLTTTPETAPDAARHARNAWRIYRAHLALAHAQAAEEARLGPVVAIEARLNTRIGLDDIIRAEQLDTDIVIG